MENSRIVATLCFGQSEGQFAVSINTDYVNSFIFDRFRGIFIEGRSNELSAVKKT